MVRQQCSNCPPEGARFSDDFGGSGMVSGAVDANTDSGECCDDHGCGAQLFRLTADRHSLVLAAGTYSLVLTFGADVSRSVRVSIGSGVDTPIHLAPLTVSGVVTLREQPIPDMAVTFTPVGEVQSPEDVRATTDVDGFYSATLLDRAPTRWHSTDQGVLDARSGENAGDFRNKAQTMNWALRGAEVDVYFPG